jgi:hypothetical protein
MLGAEPAAPKAEGPPLPISRLSESRSRPDGLGKYARKVRRAVTEGLHHVSYVEMLLTLRMAVRCAGGPKPVA